MKNSLWKRVLALVLCLALSAGYLPMPSLAEDTGETVELREGAREGSVEEPTEAPTEATEATEAPTEKPTEATEAPTEKPTEATEAPTEATEAPTEETTEPTTAPTEEQMEEVSEEAALNEGEAVASIGETTYATLQAAFDAAQDGSTITLLKDVAETVSTAADGTVTLDLNGKTLDSLAVTGGMSLTLTSSGTVTNLTLSGSGTLTLEGPTVESLTVDCRNATPKLIGRPFNKMRILAKEEMTSDEVETSFSPENFELYVYFGRNQWGPVTLYNWSGNPLVWTQEQDGYVCQINVPVYSHIHSPKGNSEDNAFCSGCDSEIIAKVGEKYHTFTKKALEEAANGPPWWCCRMNLPV